LEPSEISFWPTFRSSSDGGITGFIGHLSVSQSRKSGVLPESKQYFSKVRLTNLTRWTASGEVNYPGCRNDKFMGLRLGMTLAQPGYRP